MGTPAIRALRESFPESQIHFLVNAQRKELILGSPYIDRILLYRNNALFRFLLFWRVLPYTYDCVLVFHANEDIWKILKSVRYRNCYNRQGFRDTSRRIIPLDILPRHSIQKRLALVEKVGGKDPHNYRYDFFLPEKWITWAREQLTNGGLSPQERLVGINPGAADPYRSWPLASFVEVAKFLRASHGVKIFLNASVQEKKMVQEFKELLGDQDFFCFPGRNLYQSAALIKACSLFITNDTGPMHMAIGLEVPLIALFAPSDPEVTGPLHYPRAVILKKEKLCHPCKFRLCPNNDCLKQITVEEVCKAAEKILFPEKSQ
jgi:heptosyltransferase-2